MPFKVIYGHRFWYLSKAHMRLPISVNSNLLRILHRFRDIAVDRFKIAIFCYPLLGLTPPTEGFPGTISIKFSVRVKDGQGTKCRRKIAEIYNRLRSVHERYRQTDRQTTDGRATAYSEHEREFTFAKNSAFVTCT